MENNRGLENYKKAKIAALLVIPIQIVGYFITTLKEDNIYLYVALLLVGLVLLFCQLAKVYSYSGGFWHTMKTTFFMFLKGGFYSAAEAAKNGILDEKIIGRIGDYVIIERTKSIGSPIIAICIPFIMLSIWFNLFFGLPILMVLFVLKNDIINNN